MQRKRQTSHPVFCTTFAALPTLHHSKEDLEFCMYDYTVTGVGSGDGGYQDYRTCATMTCAHLIEMRWLPCLLAAKGWSMRGLHLFLFFLVRISNVTVELLRGNKQMYMNFVHRLRM